MGTPPPLAPGRPAGCSQFFLVMNCVHCSPAAVTQGCKEGNGFIEGENSLLSGPLSVILSSQALYPHPTVCCHVLGHTVPGTCNNQPC